MQVIEYPSASKFLDTARSMLEENEAANAIILSYSHNQTQGVESAMTTTFYCIVEEDKPVLAAMFTRGIWPLLSEGLDDAARLLARYLFPKFPTLKGVHGTKDTALAFVEEWESITKCNLEIQMNSRIYECIAVTPMKRAEGTLKQATMEDIEIVKEWRESFRIEAEVAVPGNVDEIIKQLENGSVYLWITDRPVSTALSGRGTENTGTVGAVYTPPEHRNNGYATALTAAVTQKIIDSGNKHAVLYTDLDNPTSNSIYQQIGYKPVSDSTVWLFSPALELTKRRPYS
jgi:predicted GNAT family acetyltransferase